MVHSKVPHCFPQYQDRLIFQHFLAIYRYTIPILVSKISAWILEFLGYLVKLHSPYPAGTQSEVSCVQSVNHNSFQCIEDLMVQALVWPNLSHQKVVIIF